MAIVKCVHLERRALVVMQIQVLEQVRRLRDFDHITRVDDIKSWTSLALARSDRFSRKLLYLDVVVFPEVAEPLQ